MAASATAARRLPFEAERPRHDADRQRALRLCDGRDDRCRARTGAAAEAGGDEHDVGAAERRRDPLGVLLGRSRTDLRVAAGPEAVRDRLADLEPRQRVRTGQGLRVGVADDEVHAPRAGTDHLVDGVAASTADADDPDRPSMLRKAALAARGAARRDEPDEHAGSQQHQQRADDDEREVLGQDLHARQSSTPTRRPGTLPEVLGARQTGTPAWVATGAGWIERRTRTTAAARSSTSESVATSGIAPIPRGAR